MSNGILSWKHFFNKYDCNAFGVECFELCSSMHPWNRRFTPCIAFHHSDSPTRMAGLDKPPDYYEIKSFTEAGFGATLRYDYEAHKGQTVTLARFDPSAKKILVIPGEISGGAGMDGFGCSQKVSIDVTDARETMRRMQDFGHHLSMVYGNCVEQIRDLGELMGFEVVLV